MKDIRMMMGPILYHIRVTEFQKRGLPHEYIAVALKNVPRSPAEIDSFLSAELPQKIQNGHIAGRAFMGGYPGL
jgi:hypothetical protein